MMCGEKIPVCSEVHTKHINIFCGQNVEFVNVKYLVHEEPTGLYRVS
jgi:cytidine deaminase